MFLEKLKEEIDRWIDEWMMYIPGNLGVRLRRILLRKKMKQLGKDVQIGPLVTLMHPENIEIEDNVIISGRSGFITDKETTIRIGAYTGVNFNSYLVASHQGNIIIGKHCMIAFNVVIRSANHQFDDPTRVMQSQGYTSGDVIIEDDVWIASNVVISANVRIGKGSVIAAGAVVVDDVEPYSVVGGIPARLIKRRV